MDKKFDAILAKNELARALRNINKDGYINHGKTWIISQFEAIEKVLGTANQPSAKEILNSERNDI